MRTQCVRLLSVATALFTGIRFSAVMTQEVGSWKDKKSIYEFTAKTIEGDDISLEKYRGHVCIIVNVASQCGYAKNHYEELNELYDKYGTSKGLKILAFPCNQFASQEPGNSDTICSFVRKQNVNFDMFEKVEVNGSGAHPLWLYLQNKQGGTLANFIKWNFTKFVIDCNGQPVSRAGPNTSPKDLVPILEKYWGDACSVKSDTTHQDL